jgi:hypothetical protein
MPYPPGPSVEAKTVQGCEKMNREELERILDERTFNPFVLTTMDGFAIPVRDPHKALLESLKSKTGCRGVKFFPCCT